MAPKYIRNLRETNRKRRVQIGGRGRGYCSSRIVNVASRPGWLSTCSPPARSSATMSGTICNPHPRQGHNKIEAGRNGRDRPRRGFEVGASRVGGGAPAIKG